MSSSRRRSGNVSLARWVTLSVLVARMAAAAPPSGVAPTSDAVDPRVAAPEPPASAPRTQTPRTSTPQSLAVDVEADAAGLEAEALRSAIAREAGVSVSRDPATSGPRLVIRGDGPRGLRFELFDADGKKTERTIALPEGETQKSLDTAALVAASLLEDEAAELLAMLRASAAAEPEPPPPPPPEKPTPPRRLSTVPEPFRCAARSPKLVRPFGADLVPYVGTSSVEPPGTVRRVSIEGIGGHYEGVLGFEFAPLVGFGGRFVCGVQLTGLGGGVNGPLHGLALAGFVERTEDVEGASLAGLVNLARDVKGAQIGGSVAIAKRVSVGQVAGFTAVAWGGPVIGAQLAGFAAWADGVTGAQVSGFGAVAVRRLTGVQISPLAMANEVVGAQIGAFNIAGEVRGVQLGVFNVARRSDASIGLASIVVEGRTHLEGWATSDGVVAAAVQHGGKWVHNYYGAAASLAGERGVAFGPVLGIGVHLPAGEHAFVDVDAIGHVLFDPTRSGEPQSLWQGRAVVGWAPSKRFALFAGPSYQGLMFSPDQAANVHTGYGLRVTARTTNLVMHAWPGLVAGVRAF